ncbi:hybrid sensor histidine kinase/response regulator [Bacteroidales bacterium]|nr:hybrid sensor histidine kinase/response regulator [Bacteroidales bacterium]
MSKNKPHTKFIIAAGFLIVISLSILGFTLIYNELVSLSKTSNSETEGKELVMISNILASLYETEATGSLLMGTDTEKTEARYDSIIGDVCSQIDYLKQSAQDSVLFLHLDSITDLVLLKRNNIFQMHQLLDSINNNTIVSTETNITQHKTFDDLEQLFTRSVESKEDTSIIVSDKKSFFKRVKAVFKDQTSDSIINISKNQTTKIDSAYIPTMLDPIKQYVSTIIQDNSIKNAKFTKELVYRQNAMQRVNNELTIQINKILNDIENKIYINTLTNLHKKEEALSKSSKILSNIGILAIFSTILFIILAWRSLSKSQKYRREIEKEKKHVESLLKAREILILSITHDIKAPISSIIGFIELLYKKNLPEKEKYYIENMQNSAEHILQLVKNLLEYHALDCNDNETEKMVFFPCRLMNDICSSFMPIAKKKNIKLEFNCDIKNIPNYQGDPYRIRQIANNLLANAVKFTPEGGLIVVSESIILGKEKKDDILKISIKDNGMGIKKEDQESIFHAFIRLDAHSHIEGSGLGLAITVKLIELLKGQIKLVSEYGHGAEFIVSIPLEKKDPIINKTNDDDDDDENIELYDKTNYNDKKILFIDDDIVQLNLYSEIFRQEGFDLTVCSNSLKALFLIEANSYDMIFTDIQMPEMNGFELVERIRNANFNDSKALPIIALSANSNISERKFIAAGFSGFLSKPFGVNQIMDVVRTHLGNGRFSKIKNAATSTGKGFNELIKFAGEDKDAGIRIVESFLSENKKNVSILEEAFLNEKWDLLKQTSHRMLPLMRMVANERLTQLLFEFETGSKDKKGLEELIILINNLLKDGENYISKSYN